MISEYTNEAGVRELERCINKIVRKIITEHIKYSRKIVSVRVKESDLPHYLDKELFLNSKPRKIEVPGVVKAVACNSLGGTCLDIECSSFKGNGKFICTGSLGDIAKESIEVSISYIKSNSEYFGIDESFFLKMIFIYILQKTQFKKMAHPQVLRSPQQYYLYLKIKLWIVKCL